ncbi:CLUMA_CG012923, isoform A [Clunio marinus]|uniref:CLUMA_CG012923, isoform A n=1 Tax=Clunio marinus TaxID=568069 RepID=A0A1J1IHB3_9DIPT|nr:CLUMA_CG012923, isoform A [Clunio marinus]
MKPEQQVFLLILKVLLKALKQKIKPVISFTFYSISLNAFCHVTLFTTLNIELNFCPLNILSNVKTKEKILPNPPSCEFSEI